MSILKKEKKEKVEYYSLNKIDKKNADYNVIIGQRANGKTFAVVKKYAVEAYFKNGDRLALIRRYSEELTPKNIGNLVEPHLPLIEKLSGGRFNSIKYQAREFWLVHRNEKGEVDDRSETSIIKCFSLNTWESAKGADNGFFATVLFDEFLTRKFYLPNEFICFQNLLSSILRNRDGTKIYMIANTVNKFCPYFAEMGLNNVEKMEQGTIDVYTYGSSDLKVAVEYCPDAGTSKKVSKYFAFDNPRLQMVINGKWEIDSYPHCPIEYDKDEILFHGYVKFSGKIIHGEVVCTVDDYTKQKHLFVFFYQQTKEIDLDKVDLLYTDEPDSNVMHCHNLNEVPTKIHKIFIDLIRTHNDFYNNNETGEIVRNWKMSMGLMVK